jgi:hypothetical protein
MKKTLFALLAGATLFTACNKDDNKNASARERITGQWMLTEYKSIFIVNGQSSPAINRYDSLGACERDDLYLFNTDNTLVRDEGATKCRPSTDPQTLALGTYAITNNDTRLIMPNPDAPSQIDTLELVELTGSTLRTRTVLANGNNGIQQNKTYSKR